MYRSSLAPVAPKKPGKTLTWNMTAWKKAVASPAVVDAMSRERNLGLFGAHAAWNRGDEAFGNLFEYFYRMKYPIPVHVPQ